MRIELSTRMLAAGLLGAAVLPAQDAPLATESVSINLPTNSPVTLVKTLTGESRTQVKGAALLLNLNISLILRNTSMNRIHGLTLRVVSQDVAPAGKGSVALPALNIGPDEAFPVHIEMQLMRPLQMAGGPLVEVNLDGVLFQDLSFFGPDRLNSRRSLTAAAMEAQRDREYFKRVLAQSGPEGLRRAVMASMARQADSPRLDVRVHSGGPAVTSAAVLVPGERLERFAFLEIPDSPVQAMSGWAQVTGNQARAPQIQVLNRSKKQVKYVELGWLIRDQAGHQYMAASVPASEPQLFLPAGKTAKVVHDTALTITREGKPVNIQGMSGFVSQVEFADGSMWVPNRQNIDSGDLANLLPPSAEEQRLTNLYVKKGLNALVQELNR